jgi:DNA polymerase
MDITTFKNNVLLELYKPYSHLAECPVKSYGCTRLVFGEGNPHSPLVFIGEAPGADEDAQGRPFVGRSGKLLSATLKSLGVDRSEIFITNIVKCRPPNNRKPIPSEVAFFKPLLLQELKIIRPRIICALGSSALESLISEPFSMTKVRGKLLNWEGMTILPTFHPAYVLRNPAATSDFKADLQESIAIAFEKSTTSSI